MDTKPADFGNGQIYSVTSPSGKIYIGQTVKYCSGGKPRGVDTRWKQHVNDAKLAKEGKKKATCPYLINAINKYGAENFTVEVLSECEHKQLDIEETKYIAAFDSTDPQKGYNIRNGTTKEKCKRKTTDFADNQMKMIEARRIKKYDDLTEDEIAVVEAKLSQLCVTFPPGHNSKEKTLPMYIRSFTCKRGYPGYKVQVPDYAIKTFRSGFTRSIHHALDEALDYLKECKNE